MTHFSDTLMEHFHSPVNRGVMGAADFIGKGSLDGYPPFVTLYLSIDNNRIADATFQAEGCGVTIACGSMLSELIKGRDFSECHRLTAAELGRSLDGIPTGKEYCAEVAISALRDAIRGWPESGSAAAE